MRVFFYRFTKIVPCLFLVLWIESFYYFFKYHNLTFLLLLLLNLYIVPPLSYRFAAIFFPIKNGLSYLGDKYTVSGWAVAQRFQVLYHNLEFLERILKMIPEFYSAWLRLWGSTVGKGIYWTPHTRIADRTHLVIGDGVLIGNASYLSPHVVKKKDNRYLLFLRPIILKNNSLVGTHCTLGPGSILEEGQSLEAFEVMMGRKVVGLLPKDRQ